MGCINCNNSKDTVFFIEKYPCTCGNYVKIFYNLCSKCGAFWRSCNGVLLDNVSIVELEELDNVILNNLLKNKNIDDEVEDFGMRDTIVRCVACNAPAYRKAKNVYCCSICKTEWELM